MVAPTLLLLLLLLVLWLLFVFRKNMRKKLLYQTQIHNKGMGQREREGGGKKKSGFNQ